MPDAKSTRFPFRTLIACLLVFGAGWIARDWMVKPDRGAIIIDIDPDQKGDEDIVIVGTPVVVPPPKTPPEKLPEEAFIERYPVGKTIRSVGILHASGRGSNKEWGVKGSVNFNYLVQIPVETQVLESDAQHGRLLFEQDYGAALQELAISDEQLELVPPDNIPLSTFWPLAEETLKLLPPYDKFRQVADWINAADPALKRTLTTLHGWLKRGGVELRPTDKDLQIKVAVDKLAGCRFQIVYQSGLGVTSITLLNEGSFDRAEMIRLAHSCNVVADYFIFPALQRRSGETWDVQAADVGNLFAFYDPTAELSGSVKLSRGIDEGEGSIARLELQSGRLRIHSQVDGTTREGTLVVKEGVVMFDQDHRFVQRAHVEFSASTLQQSRDHLLFGTENVRDLRIESRFSAEFLSPETSNPAVDSEAR